MLTVSVDEGPERRCARSAEERARMPPDADMVRCVECGRPRTDAESASRVSVRAAGSDQTRRFRPSSSDSCCHCGGAAARAGHTRCPFAPGETCWPPEFRRGTLRMCTTTGTGSAFTMRLALTGSGQDGPPGWPAPPLQWESHSGPVCQTGVGVRLSRSASSGSPGPRGLAVPGVCGKWLRCCSVPG